MRLHRKESTLHLAFCLCIIAGMRPLTGSNARVMSRRMAVSVRAADGKELGCTDAERLRTHAC